MAYPAMEVYKVFRAVVNVNRIIVGSCSIRDIFLCCSRRWMATVCCVHDILSDLASLLASLIKPQGFLVLSGILKGDQECSIGAIYAKQGLTYVKNLFKDEWAALLFQKT